MRCPYCREIDDKVVDSRLAEDGVSIRRRRECLVCGRRFTTYERVEETALVVRKRSGSKEPYDRRKLRMGLERAVSDRVARERLDTTVAEIEEHLRAIGPEVSTDQIGVAVLERLRLLDAVSYLRFASVYKGFENLSDFEREVGLLQKTTAPKRVPRAADPA